MKPILFNTEMVRAILDGRKRVTRRLIKPEPPPRAPGEVVKARHCVDRMWAFYVYDQKGEWMYSSTPYKQPYEVGDILYVRETWAITSRIRDIADDGPVYMADLSEMELRYLRDKGFKWRPSIHMPKDLARLFLRVTDIRAERLRQIEIEGFIKEGINPSPLKPDGCKCTGEMEDCHLLPCANRDAYEYLEYALPFSELWDSTIKPAEREKYSWNANPWVWVIRFEQIEKPKTDGLTSN